MCRKVNSPWKTTQQQVLQGSALKDTDLSKGGDVLEPGVPSSARQ